MKQYGTGRGFSISAGISGMVPAEKISVGYQTALQALGCRFLETVREAVRSWTGRENRRELGLHLPPGK